MSDCAWIDLGCHAAQKITNDGLDALVGTVQEGTGKAFAAFGTIWTKIPTPTVTGDGGSTTVTATDAANADGLSTVLGYVSWVGFIVAILSMLFLFAMWGWEQRHGATPNLTRLGAICTGVLLMSSATGVVTKLMPVASAQQGTGPVAFLQQSTWWIAGGLAVLSILIGGARIAWEQRFDHTRDLVQSLLTLVIVAGGGLGVIATLASFGDGFSDWILNAATDRDFGANISLLIGTAAQSGVGTLAFLVLGFIAVLATFVQIGMMIARGSIIVVLAGGLPVAVSFTSMPAGRAMAGKYVGWLLAFLAYKPAAAFIYAAAFQLIGTHMFEDDDTGLLQMISGLALLILAIVAMPALMRLIVPAAGAVAGGAAFGAALGAAGAAAGKGMELATGAIKRAAASRGGGSGGGGGGGGPTNGPGSESGSPTGASDQGKKTNTAPSTGRQQPAPGSAGDREGTAGGGAAPTGAATSKTAAGSAAGGAGAGSGAAAAAKAAGPVRIAAGAAMTAASKTVQAAAAVAKGAGSDVTGE